MNILPEKLPQLSGRKQTVFGTGRLMISSVQNERLFILTRTRSGQLSSVQFSSVQDGVYALGKAHNYALQHVSQKFLHVA